jgi:hypothetical protein
MIRTAHSRSEAVDLIVQQLRAVLPWLNYHRRGAGADGL